MMLALWTMCLTLQDPGSADASPLPSLRERTLISLSINPAVATTKAAELGEIWNDAAPPAEAVSQTAALFRPEVRSLLDSNLKPQEPLSDELDSFIQSSVAQALASRWIDAGQHEAALELLNKHSPYDSADPGRHLFLRACAAFEIGAAEQARGAIDELKKIGKMPRRYESLAQAIEQTINSTDPESLAGVALDMRGVRRRLDLGQIDSELKATEDDIIRRLDIMIKKVEEKHETTSPTSQPSQPNAPAEESKLAGASGTGEVDSKQVRDPRAWGNLPAKEREKTMQDIGRDLPGPYRSAVEEYFRKLARAPRSQP